MPIDDPEPSESSNTSRARYFMIVRRDDGAHLGMLDDAGDAQRLSETLQWDIVSTHEITFDGDRGRPGFTDRTVPDRKRAIDLVCMMADKELPEGWDLLHVIQHLIGQAYEAGLAAEREARRPRFLLVRQEDGQVRGMLWRGPTMPQSHGEVIGEIPLDFGEGPRAVEQAKTLQAFFALGDVALEALDLVFTAGLHARPPAPPETRMPSPPAPPAKRRTKSKKKPATRRKRP